MGYEVVWTEPASMQLEEIRDYIAADNPLAARKVVERIIARVGRLKSLPRIGAVYGKGGKHPVRKIVSGSYRIFYRIVEDAKRVEILLVWHAARRDPDFSDHS